MTDLSPEQIRSLGSQALLITFVITAALGAIMQRTNFCTLGAVSDGILMEDWSRMRQWCLAIGIAILGVAFMSHLGWIDVTKSLYTGNRVLYLSTFIGSVLFGIGMVLASGCGSKTLVRIGSGNLKSIVVFIVLGLVAYMTMRGFLGVLRTNSIDQLALNLKTTQDLPSVLSASVGMGKEQLRWILSLGIGGAFIAYALLKKSFWNVENLLAGVGVGLAITAIWWVSGHFAH
ncbi:MAG: YeeE/YedE family protein, partial [Burkholderiaceae bacterium]|nr:YeeE/YedE family protein [Burkholderiaceae bacterium]